MNKIFYKNIDGESKSVEKFDELKSLQQNGIIRSYTLVYLPESNGWLPAEETELRFKGFAEWFLFFEETKVMTGPFYMNEIEEMITSFELEPYQLCWCKGFKVWKPLIESDFKVSFQKIIDNILL